MAKFYRVNLVEMEPEVRENELDGIPQHGYKITYPDGYQSWCPKEAANKCSYKEGTHDFNVLKQAMEFINSCQQAPKFKECGIEAPKY